MGWPAALVPQAKRVVILGGGISGLTAAWTLRHLGNNNPITLIDRAPHPGGWIKTERSGEGGHLFERGPRGFRPTGTSGTSVLRLLDELQCQHEAIGTDPAGVSRWLWFDGQLQQLPDGLMSLLTTPIGRQLLAAVIREPFQPRRRDAATAAERELEDESIDAFARRRFGPFVADKLFDAMVGGIFAGDSRKLSVASCFPILVDLERQHGSVVVGMLQNSLFGGAPQDAGVDAALTKPLSDGCLKLQKSLQVRLGWLCCVG